MASLITFTTCLFVTKSTVFLGHKKAFYIETAHLKLSFSHFNSVSHLVCQIGRRVFFFFYHNKCQFTLTDYDKNNDY